MRVGLVGCVKAKRRTPAAARDLYTSPLFRGGRLTVEQNCDRWFILSARHGLLTPDTVIEPYDETLSTASRAHRRHWSANVLGQLRTELGDLAAHEFEVHAGAAYCEFGLVAGLRDAGADVDLPLARLRMGERLAYYRAIHPSEHGEPRDRPRSDSSPSTAIPAPKPTHQQWEKVHFADPTKRPSGSSKYRPLYEHLVKLSDDRWDATFEDVDQLLPGGLPTSARRHRAWWANEAPGGAHAHARAWLAAGFQTADVRLGSQRVTFRRAR